ncbi:hypothetical protein [Paracoccus albus]|uniref:hypothetical protein n=1 Tax=Paracoccus albus TaxID=3017784 RepID=UPI0022F0CF7B|nr:hypothetical protein [Paracoccus albus]WBU60209.1 hypothetical protein PAF20_15950 [Paracoccus albus]
MSWDLILSVASAMLPVPLALYCYVLSRRLRKLNDLESGLGAAIAVMSAEVARLERSIRRAKTEAEQAAHNLCGTIATARDEQAQLALRQDITRAGGIRPRRLKPRRTERAGADA